MQIIVLRLQTIEHLLQTLKLKTLIYRQVLILVMAVLSVVRELMITEQPQT